LLGWIVDREPDEGCGGGLVAACLFLNCFHKEENLAASARLKFSPRTGVFKERARTEQNKKQ